MLQRDGVVMTEMKVLVMMVMMMIMPMKPSSMAVMMAMISPLREGIFLANFCLPESFLSLCVFAPQRRRILSVILLPVLGFQGDDIHEGAMVEVG
jgi:hypothetical protein